MPSNIDDSQDKEKKEDDGCEYAATGHVHRQHQKHQAYDEETEGVHIARDGFEDSVLGGGGEAKKISTKE